MRKLKDLAEKYASDQESDRNRKRIFPEPTDYDVADAALWGLRKGLELAAATVEVKALLYPYEVFPEPTEGSATDLYAAKMARLCARSWAEDIRALSQGDGGADVSTTLCAVCLAEINVADVSRCGSHPPASRDAELAAKEQALQISAAQFDKAQARIRELEAMIDQSDIGTEQKVRRIATLEQCVTDWVDTDLASKRRIATLTSALDEAESVLEWYGDPKRYLTQAHDGEAMVELENDMGYTAQEALAKIREVRNG